MTKATTLLGGAWGEGAKKGVGWWSSGFKISDTQEPPQDPSIALPQLMGVTQTCLSVSDVPIRSPGTDEWTQYAIMFFHFFSFCDLFVGYARLGTWGWRISLFKVWQLIITLVNASFESLISNCLQEPNHGTLLKRADQLSPALFSLFVSDNHIINKQTYECEESHIFASRQIACSLFSDTEEPCSVDDYFMSWARRMHATNESTHVGQSWQIVKKKLHWQHFLLP